MPIPTPEEAKQHVERIWDEIGRLKEHFQQRTKDEKKRLGALEQLLPKLKRLAKPLSVARASAGVQSADRISAEEQGLLSSLSAPPARPEGESKP
jgi:hypothetical protein